MRDYTPRTFHFSPWPFLSTKQFGAGLIGDQSVTFQGFSNPNYSVFINDASWTVAPNTAACFKDIHGKYFFAKKRLGITLTNLDPLLPVQLWAAPPPGAGAPVLLAVLSPGVGQVTSCALRHLPHRLMIKNATSPSSLPNCLVLEEYEEKSFRISRPIVQANQYGDGQIINTQLTVYGEGANDAAVGAQFLDRGYIANTDRFIRGNDGLRYVIRQRLGYTLYNFDTTYPLKVLSTIGDKVLQWLAPATNANTPTMLEMDEVESCDLTSGGNGFKLSKGTSGPLNCVLTGHYEAASLLEYTTTASAPGLEPHV